MYKTDEEKRQIINNSMRYIAYNIFGVHKKDKYKFIAAYEKLKSRVYLDWDIRIDDLIQDSTTSSSNMFDHLNSDMLDKVYRSSVELTKMYSDVIGRRRVA